MYWPFVVFSLPRSRSAWLQHWLGGPALVGHDLATTVASVDEWLEALWHGRSGTIETGSPELASVALSAMPGTRLALIRRPVGEVVDSLRRVGLSEAGWPSELERRDAILAKLESTGIPSLRFSELNDANACAWLFDYLVGPSGLHFDFDWWQVASATNIQIDARASVMRQLERASALRVLQSELDGLAGIESPGPRLRIGREPWASFWPDAQSRVADDHFAVHGKDGTLGRPFATDVATFAELEASGRLLLCTARENGRLIAYLGWILSPALQSAGTVIAGMGPIFCDPGHWGVAKRMFDWSLRGLRQLGISNVEFSCPVDGPGAALARHFLRLGAIPSRQTFSLFLGPKAPVSEETPDA